MITFKRMEEIREMSENGTLDSENLNTEEARFALSYIKAGLARKTIDANKYNAWSILKLQKIIEAIEKSEGSELSKS